MEFYVYPVLHADASSSETSPLCVLGWLNSQDPLCGYPPRIRLRVRSLRHLRYFHAEGEAVPYREDLCEKLGMTGEVIVEVAQRLR